MLSLVSKLLNLIHFLLLLVPFIIYGFPKKLIRPYAKWILLVTCLIPMHWVFFDKHCIFTIASKKMGDYQDTKTNSGFSEANLKWLYGPIMRLFDWKWDDAGLNKMVHLHWIVNILLVWYFVFYFV